MPNETFTFGTDAVPPDEGAETPDLDLEADEADGIEPALDDDVDPVDGRVEDAE